MNFNFELYKPKKIVEINRLINEKWEAASGSVTIMGLERIVNKIIQGRYLSRREIVQVIFNLEGVCSHNKLSNFSLVDLQVFIVESADNAQIDGRVRDDLIKYCYQAMLRYYRNKEYVMLLSNIGQIFISENSESEYAQLLLGVVSEQENVLAFLKEMWFKEVQTYKSLAIEDFLEKTKVRAEMTIFQDMIIYSFKSNIETILKVIHDKYDIDLLRLFEKQKAMIEDKKQAYQNLLMYYKNYNTPLAKFSKPWMTQIIADLGEPLARDPYTNWYDIKEDLYLLAHKWFINSRLEELFGLTVNDQRRLDFWKKYLDHITNIYYHEYSNQAILIEMDKKHTVVEFGKIGNACYIYPSEYISIDQLEKIIKQNGKYGDYTSSLKNPYSAVVDKLIHSGYWEHRFALSLLGLGYKRG